jgi:hypothetical protein
MISIKEFPFNCMFFTFWVRFARKDNGPRNKSCGRYKLATDGI